MKKKIIIITITAFVLALVIIKLYQARQYFVKSQKKISPTPTILKKSPEIKEYTDETGFKFQYPDNLTLEQKTDLEESEYSVISLKSSDTAGNIAIEITDTKLKDSDQYLLENKISTKSAKLEVINLSDIAGIQISFEKNITAVAIDNGILYEIKVNMKKNKTFWLDAYKKITSSFEFSESQEDSAAQTQTSFEETSSDDSVEETEEVIE